MKFDKNISVAIATDYMNSFGGADRVLQSLLRIFPNADVYTTQINYENYPWLKNKVYTSFLQNFFFRKIIYRTISVLAPFAFESFDLRNYDLVISISAGPAKGVITSTNTKHISIICTPPRHQWDGDMNIRASIFKIIYSLGSFIVSTFLRIWDIVAISRVDHIISISKYIQSKVLKIYRRESKVIYPSISDLYLANADKYTKEEVFEKFVLPNEYILVASRLFDYKKIDVAINICKKLSQNLVVVGDGPDINYLKKLAKSSNTLFLRKVSDDELKIIYRYAQALIFPGVEDFGIVPLEAMSQGTPVIAYNVGGVKETVIDGKTGILYNTLEQLEEIILKKKYLKLKKKDIMKRAIEFNDDRYIKELKNYIIDKIK